MGSELAQATVSGLQPIHLAVLSEHIPSLDMLIDLDVDIDAKTPQANTPLHLAAERGLLSSVKWLIDQGAVLNFRNGQRKNPMDLAIEKGHTSIANLIQACVSKLKNGEDVTEILKQYPQSSS
ncbi:CARD- and ANK-domain containing inflammasome adapter protein-like [Symsagittifera roscoffensis]|uniref:CARD- and ANK-domain containing inflammasome adapter protein-like n=1 Tax=Symsagittifera roscoffensis TaxID=84072 RepID=UPI00307B8345